MNAFPQYLIRLVMLLVLGLPANLPLVGAQSNRNLFDHLGATWGSSDDQAFMRLMDRPTTSRATIAHIDRSVLDEGYLQLNPFPGLSLEARQTHLGFSGAHNRAWFGDLADNQGSAVFIINGDRISGKINSSQGTFEIFPLGGGDCVVVEHFPDKFPDCGVDAEVLPKRKRGYRPGEDTLSMVNGDTVSGIETEGFSLASDSIADTPMANRVRVIVAYTSGARNKTHVIFGRTMQEHIDLAIAESNQGYANSGVDLRIELACLYQTDFVETRVIEEDVEAFRDNGDGRGDEVHQLRADYDADMCSLITDGSDFAWCGYSYGFDYTDRENMFQATSYTCCTSNFAFVHEFGHIQGVRHDSDAELTPFAFGHGYRNGSSWRTIMALAGDTAAPRLNYWSSPIIESPVLPFTPMGTPVNGDLFANDCRTALNMGRDTVVNHETTPVNSSAPNDYSFETDEYADKVVTGILSVGSFTAKSGSRIQFRAGSGIVLQPGFHAHPGSSFRALLLSNETTIP